MSVLEDFNTTIIDFVEQLSLVCPNSIISNNLGNLRFVLNAFPDKIIELFIIHVLPDKEKIDNGDEQYFLNKSYNEDIKELDAKSLFEFKDVWCKLSNENKKLVIMYMQCLCSSAQDYFLERYAK